MKIIDYIEDSFPDYALPYVVNGDDSGIEDEDRGNCDAWLEHCTAKLRKDYPDAVAIELLFEEGEGKGSFIHSPAFGLACNTVTCAVAVFVDNEDSRPALALPWEEEEEEEEEEIS